ncbi:Protein held out wings-like, protein [Aphelenchoides besseyi]|nr:Protein held out wings-like, protein [Aphelenchoides besseyi]
MSVMLQKEANKPTADVDYLTQLLNDKKQFAASPNVFQHSERLLDDEINRVRVTISQCEDTPNRCEVKDRQEIEEASKASVLPPVNEDEMKKQLVALAIIDGLQAAAALAAFVSAKNSSNAFNLPAELSAFTLATLQAIRNSSIVHQQRPTDATTSTLPTTNNTADNNAVDPFQMNAEAAYCQWVQGQWKHNRYQHTSLKELQSSMHAKLWAVLNDYEDRAKQYAMTTVTELYARVILLEEYRNGTSVEKAMEKVRVERGPNAINRAAAVCCYEFFKDGYERIADTAKNSDRRLIENGTFLRSKRSLVCELNGFRELAMSQIHGGDSRFLIVQEYGHEKNWMVDTFNETIKPILIDFSAIEEVNKPDYFDIKIICFIGNSTVCGAGYCSSKNKILWFKGKFDDVNAVLCIEMVKILEEFEQFQLTLNTQAQPPTLTHYWDSLYYSCTVDLANGNLSEVKVTNMHHNLWSPIIRDGKLFGFPDDPNRGVNVNKMFEISLVDGSTIEHEIENENNIEVVNYIDSSFWINDKLLVEVIDWHSGVSTVYKFDITQMKWESTKIEVEDDIKSMTLTDERFESPFVGRVEQNLSLSIRGY